MKTVTVIGASMAGLGAAYEILKRCQDVKVTIIDKKRRVGDNVICAGGISDFMIRQLKLTIPERLIATKINSVRICAPSGVYWEIKGKKNIAYGYVLYRDSFEIYLASKIAELGGKFQLNRKVNNLDEINSNIIIGADGLTGITSRTLIGMPIPEDVHLGVQRIAVLKHPKNRIDLYFGSEFAPKGYAWIFPEGQSVVRIGLGIPVSERKNPAKLLDKFISYVGASPISKVKAKLIPTAPPPKRLVFNNIALIGDAGHLCDPLTGGGIANALLSGKHVAKAISRNNLSLYDKYCSGLKRRNMYRYRLKRILYDLTDEDFNEMIMAMRNFKPTLIRISWAFVHAILTIALKRPRFFTKYKILRRLFGVL